MLRAMESKGGIEKADIGIVGAGQLARMMVQAAIPLGIHIRLLAARPDDGAARVSPDVMFGAPDDPKTLEALARGCDVVTFDHELVPAAVLRDLERQGASLHPSADVMALAQDKRQQRETFAALGLPVPPFSVIAQPDELVAFGEQWRWPVVVKSARSGYDGRGVWVVESPDEARQLARTLLDTGIEPVAEQWVPIEREVAILIARRPSGERVVYPVVETVQIRGICREIVAPASIPAHLTHEAAAIALRIAESIGLVGILAVELFVSEGRLIINEIATRPHNSGHYSIEGCVTSQFEQHLRAVLDWPLGATDLTAPAVVTVNILGNEAGEDPRSRLPEALAIPGAHVHLYGKEARPGRKLGHVTVCGMDMEDVRERARRAAAILGAALPEPVAV